MSLAKRELDRQLEEGCSHPGGSVCRHCFNDYAIQDFISKSLTEYSCDYCNRKSNKPFAADFNKVLSFISEGLWRAYERPEDCLPYDSREGGWQGVEPYHAWDVIGNLDLDATSELQLQEDIVNAFSDNSFVQRDPFALTESDQLFYSWEGFTNHIKHNTRFVFFRQRGPRPKRDEFVHPDDRRYYTPPHQILKELGGLVMQYGLISTLPKKSKLVRARQHHKKDKVNSGKALGSPPEEIASQSRMSPAGIPMFYGATDARTCFHEALENNRGRGRFMTFGEFETQRMFRVLDLTRIPRTPSIFDEENYRERQALIFLHALERDLSKPVKRDGKEHYEYVPTQVVAEYFCKVFRYKRKPLNGVAFNSSRREGGICICLFITNDQCQENNEWGHQLLLSLKSHQVRKIDFEGGTIEGEFPDYGQSQEQRSPLQMELPLNHSTESDVI